jgi:hypothetical protein
MLQVARLAPKQLGESRDLVARFLRDRLNPDGGFQNRVGRSDLYYTVFGLDGLIALQEDVPVERTLGYLTAFDDGADLDFVHLSCLTRAWAALRHPVDEGIAQRVVDRVESFRSADGGYSTGTGEPEGTAYAAFMAMNIYNDLGREMPNAPALSAALHTLRATDGSYGNFPGLPSGLTTTTAAVVVMMRHLGAPGDRNAGMWLLDRCHASGGFFAATEAPIPDLLSTATALHALTSLHVPLSGIRERCLDFVDTLWTNRGGFYGHWDDDAADCEYTYYALLALGHLSLEGS